MSTIKSSAEHLTLNADGASKDIKFQANGVEKASISSAGAFTSTTIDATALTGTIPNFTSTGIDDNADATAITIDSSENVGIGVTSPQELLHIKDGSIAVGDGTAANNTQVGRIGFSTDSANSRFIGMECYRGSDAANGDLRFHTYGGDSNAGERLRITNDGRGLSQFTAKAWVNFNGTSTVAIRDSHNVSSVSDNGTGHYSINFANNLANINYVAAGMSGIGHFMTNLNAPQSVGDITIYTTDHAGSNNDKPYNYLMVIGA